MASIINATSFAARFPEFNEQQASVIEATLDKAERDTPADVWTDTNIRIDAVAYLSAHLLAMRITQIGVQVGASSGQSAGAGYDSTLYGQEYKRMRDCLPVCGFSHCSEQNLFY